MTAKELFAFSLEARREAIDVGEVVISLRDVHGIAKTMMRYVIPPVLFVALVLGLMER